MMQIVSRFIHCGLQCMTTISPMGIPCGYVGLPKEHPYFGKHYDDIENIEVHGGLTFSGYWEEIDDKELYWYGFDCGHAWDMDMDYSRGQQMGGHSIPLYHSNKSSEFVEEQTRRLAEQLEKIK
jgi:hypothetical protein